eukprot:13508776-Alexandrium_andersonii.AAC.1
MAPPPPRRLGGSGSMGAPPLAIAGTASVVSPSPFMRFSRLGLIQYVSNAFMIPDIRPGVNTLIKSHACTHL